jgi:hypothetical protein
MILAMCPACRCTYRVVGPAALNGQNAQRTYDLTHCGACETSTGLFLPLKDTPPTLIGEFGAPPAVVPVFDGKYADWALADAAMISTCAQAGLRARLVHRLAEEMRVPLLVLAGWIGLNDAETLSTPARKALKPGMAECLLHVARFIGIIQLRAGRESELATTGAAPWLGTWLQAPHPELGGARPGDYLQRPQDRLVLTRRLERTAIGSEP